MTNMQRRRRFLAGVGTVSSIAVAGCLGGDSDPESGATAGGDTLQTHPLGQDVREQPWLGPDPLDASATLIVLDDPSCPRCAAFHQGTLSELKATHVEAGTLSIVARPYPVVYEWGGPASHALEATFDRDEAAFWDLQDYYFDQQSSFDASNVVDRTETWLDDNTSLDGGAVADDVRTEAFADRIEATLQAGEDAGAGGTTPASFAFADGEFRTSLNGSQSTETIETALEL